MADSKSLADRETYRYRLFQGSHFDLSAERSGAV
jgi:hypothetical protein